jgi:hypothetical protein
MNELITEIQNNSTIAFLCETWLQPFELQHTKRTLSELGLWCHLKSSIDPEEVLVGRPYGGVGFVCKPLDGVVYNPIEVDCHRIVGLQLINNGSIVLNIIGVYLPYYNGTADQSALYSETLDILQTIVDD